MPSSIHYLYNAEAMPLAEVPVLDLASFRETVIGHLAAGGRLSALFAAPRQNGLRLHAVLCSATREQVGLVAAEVGGNLSVDYFGLCGRALV